jgi:hypothetical protein
LGNSISKSHHDTQYEGFIAYRQLKKTLHVVLIFMIFPWYVASCGTPVTPYRPPTMVIQTSRPTQATTAPTLTTQVNQATLPISTPTCTDNLVFLEDLSLPDGTVVKPGAIMDKRWLVENSGTCDWDQYYRLKFMSGSELNAPLDQALFPARSGSKATIWMTFTAPSEPGSYQSAWQAYNPQGQPFGDLVYIRVTVGSDEP